MIGIRFLITNCFKIISERTRASVMIRQFARNITPPLNAMRAMTDLIDLALDEDSINDARFYLKQLNFQIHVLNELANDLSVPQQLKKGTLQVNLIPYDLNDGLQRAVDDVGDIASFQGVNILYDLAPQLKPALVDVACLRQALWNLLIVIIHTSRPNSTLTIRTWPQGKWYYASIMGDFAVSELPEQPKPSQNELILPANEGNDHAGYTHFRLHAAQALIQAMNGQVFVRTSTDAQAAVTLVFGMSESNPPS